MVPEVLACLDRTIEMLRESVAGLSDADMVLQPPGISNHAMWTLGHVVYSCQAISGELGVEAWLAASWESLFGRGTMPSGRSGDYPTKAALLDALVDAHERLRRAVLRAGEAGLAAPLPDERYRHMLPSLGHAVVEVLAGHMAYHAGQLAMWRRAIGRKPIGGFV